MKLIRDMYDEVALITGFPIYTNETDKPDTDRFILHCLSEGLENVIDTIYMHNNVLERNDRIITIPNQDLYGLEGIIKNIQLVRPNGSLKQIRYSDLANKDNEVNHSIKDDTVEPVVKMNTGEPHHYVIKNGYLKLLPMPDKEYELKLTLSTKHLVLSNNDLGKTSITDIEDSLLTDNEFAKIVTLRAAVLIFARAQSPNAQIYSEICNQRIKDYMERDNGTMEAQRGYLRDAGHYQSGGDIFGW